MARYFDKDVFEAFGYTTREGTFDDGVQFVLEKIDAMPTVDVRENKHGKWTEFCECSVCGFSSNDFGIAQIRLCDFCPNCGADMKGGKQ